MKMRYPNGKPRIFEATTDRGNYSATKIDLNTFQATHVDPKPGIAAVPIRSVTPKTEPAKFDLNTLQATHLDPKPATNKFEPNPTKVNKKKPSTKSFSQTAAEVLRPKKRKKKPSASTGTRGQTKPGANVERKDLNVVFDEANLDFSKVPPPYCSCTGVARGCYRWGAGGWQSSCCNTSISEYPLPMSSMRPRARLAGRKMSKGAYRKLLCRLAAEGCDLSHPVDLKNHWAKHGTNKFVTIK